MGSYKSIFTAQQSSVSGLFIFSSPKSLATIGLFAVSMCTVCSVTHSCPTLCNPWTTAHQDHLSMEFSRQEYWSGSPFPTPGNLPNPGIELMSFAYPALAGGFFTIAQPGKPKWKLKKNKD